MVAEAGLLVFSTVGGVPEPDIAGHDDDDVVVGDVIVGNEGVGDDDDEDEDDDDDRKTQDPVLGLMLTIMAVPPKSQLDAVGFF